MVFERSGKTISKVDLTQNENPETIFLVLEQKFYIPKNFEAVFLFCIRLSRRSLSLIQKASECFLDTRMDHTLSGRASASGSNFIQCKHSNPPITIPLLYVQTSFVLLEHVFAKLNASA